MLVCCRMIYDIRMIIIEYPVHSVCVTDRPYEHYKIEFRMIDLKFLLKIINAVLIYIYYYELLGMMTCDLPAEFTSD